MLLRAAVLAASVGLACDAPEGGAGRGDPAPGADDPVSPIEVEEAELGGGDGCAVSCEAFIACVLEHKAIADCDVACEPGGNPCETADDARARHLAVARRREHRLVMVHRGSWELGKENTLEAYRATLELGADGNEIDVRRTADDRLVMFHDDFLDGHLRGYGEVADHTWAELRRLAWRDEGPHGEFTRIPAFVEALDVHRRYAGLLHLDIKDAGIDDEIVALLDALDMWDHVQVANDANANAVLAHPQYDAIHGMTGLTDGRRDVDGDALEAAITSGAAGFFVDDPRPVLVRLGRPLGRVSTTPERPREWDAALVPDPGRDAVLRILLDDADWDAFDDDSPQREERIRARARAALAAADHGHDDPEILDALRNRVAQRSLHRDWRWHALDGKEAFAALVRLGADDVVDLGRQTVMTDDDAIRTAAGDDAGWWDWRLETVVFPMLARDPSPALAELARDYLALSPLDAEAQGFPLYDAAAAALLACTDPEADARALLSHPRSEVRARARLELVRRAADGESWARAALEHGAPEALAWIPDPG